MTDSVNSGPFLRWNLIPMNLTLNHITNFELYPVTNLVRNNAKCVFCFHESILARFGKPFLTSEFVLDEHNT